MTFKESGKDEESTVATKEGLETLEPSRRRVTPQQPREERETTKKRMLSVERQDVVTRLLH